MKLATFAAGCFWGVEELFRGLDGVIKTRVGYVGGHTVNPSYKEVCTDTTGHAEAVEICYDQDKVSYEELLKLFWQNHNPTQLNAQGPDIGSQYRSAIFYHDEHQEKLAIASKQALIDSKRFKQPIVTQIEKATQFYEAEEYHQQYLAKRGGGSCSLS